MSTPLAECCLLYLFLQAHCVLEGDNACVFLSTTPDLTSELANAAHHKALNCLFGYI